MATHPAFVCSLKTEMFGFILGEEDSPTKLPFPEAENNIFIFIDIITAR